MPRIIQIVGKAPTPDGVPVLAGTERWIIGSAAPDLWHVPYARIFDVHPVGFIQDRRPDLWAWYGQQTEPVYLVEWSPEIPASVRYPREAITDRFGPTAGRAFSSSVDHMMALALYEGVDLIRLDGVRMNSMEEWHTQRECLAYWIGVARGMGVDVITDPEAALVTPAIVYGFDERTGADRAPGQPVMVYGVPGSTGVH